MPSRTKSRPLRRVHILKEARQLLRYFRDVKFLIIPSRSQELQVLAILKGLVNKVETKDTLRLFTPQILVCSFNRHQVNPGQQTQRVGPRAFRASISVGENSKSWILPGNRCTIRWRRLQSRGNKRSGGTAGFMGAQTTTQPSFFFVFLPHRLDHHGSQQFEVGWSDVPTMMVWPASCL